MVEVVGEAVEVHKAIELIGQHLRKFLVDRGIISVFEKQVIIHSYCQSCNLFIQMSFNILTSYGPTSIQMQAHNSPMEHIPPQPWGSHHGHPPSGGSGLGGYGMQYMPPPRQMDNYYPPAEMAPPPDRQPHQGISAYGREPPIGVHASSNTQPAPSLITQVFTCLPLFY